MHLLLEHLKNKLGDSVLEMIEARDMPVVICKKESIYQTLKLLRDDPELDFNILTDLSAVDYLNYPEKKRQRFEVVYHLHSLDKGHRLRVKVPVGGADPALDSACTLWKTANWLEREVWDMYGIQFVNHPNLKRILNHIEFVGHPLRKDYPIDKRQVLTVNDSLMDEMEKRLIEKGLK
ncbi:NADH-quinone oxidoreductase subunit C [bacterium (Candidatus Blackallbacteria) CG17_big_fil_post_rev_8_21_14_2_50_48_46]|uniref:NADH-quinone oxidoreductase subunit C n=1 Tax=bacterium (Candidatus Blackallbacteria) CG17_big_fil_post_rev_8_21_14_2_50_48_46 TaxID=2014261 RepID=A0A2M7G5W3_9BACT|nr:MAG: NADH-quinone oxidoreductase subunit C [bacterium (Candidatus Blackallbacteria) CG18_big_fil_WC_8_21_14_2_50_49_26]PIW17377.1 MAG: NADH-quinone oxidoreductase subunit C [bacterium (Candidatus Blackallbacteria) CG17_big_fil_post_rev_8_21_14_2_50_48_46]PIW47481.1 MAG: NADH-quinone oxidoreductase subunit C [bacterium (Candidatus Blackallbacteria) CG13_big_fil_rev_8_21_14_2_50_49_14]